MLIAKTTRPARVPPDTRSLRPSFVVVAIAFAAVVCVPRSSAQNILGPASDLLTTPAGGASGEDFSTTPIPPGFFGPGSDPFVGIVTFQGSPLEGPGVVNQADTIVRRLTTAPIAGCPATAQIPIEIVALNLISVNPITITFGGGLQPTQYEVRACLSSLQPQVQGQMIITRTSLNGGTFNSTLPVRPRLIFTRCSNPAGPGLASVTGDPSPPITLQTNNGAWTYSPLGLPIDPSPGGAVDHDCNPATPMVAFPPTSNFVVGVVENPPGSCTAPGGPPRKRLTPEQELLAAHGILPACRPPGTKFGFGDGTFGPCPCGNFGLPGRGCENSFGTGGGLLYGSGTAQVSADDVEINAEFLPPSASGILVQGDTALAVGVANGDGLLGVTGTPLLRLYTKFASCGKMHFGQPVGDVPISVRGALPVAGGTRHYQLFYRNAAVFCTASTYNWTNCYTIVWAP